MRDLDAVSVATHTLHVHGERAGQYVVDRMIAAIRAHDMDHARFWDAVGQAVDKVPRKSSGSQRSNG